LPSQIPERWETLIDEDEENVAGSGHSVNFILLQFIGACKGDESVFEKEFADAFATSHPSDALRACLLYFLDFPTVADTYA